MVVLALGTYMTEFMVPGDCPVPNRVVKLFAALAISKYTARSPCTIGVELVYRRVETLLQGSIHRICALRNIRYTGAILGVVLPVIFGNRKQKAVWVVSTFANGDVWFFVPSTVQG